MRRRAPDGSQRGSALMLFPAGVLVVIVLAAIAVDSSIAFLAQRELTDATAASANDAASRALSEPAYYGDGSLQIDAARLEAIAVEAVSAVVDQRRHLGLRVEAAAQAPVTPGCGWTVTVTASSSVRHLFARALPGGAGTSAVAATSVARPQRSSGPATC